MSDSDVQVEGVVEFLREGRKRERSQTAFYRRLAMAAEEAGDVQAIERVNELLADEQHHLSRLSARLMELGDSPPPLEDPAGTVQLDGWEMEARAREAGEVSFYKAILCRGMDSRTREMLEEILHSERHHREELRGKWMSA